MGPTPSSLESDPADLVALWEHAQDHLGNDAAQRVFLEACVERRNLAFAARCYRQLLARADAEGDEETRDRCQGHLETIVGLSFSLLKATSTPPPRFRRISTWVAAALCFVLLLAVALSLRG